MTPVSLEPAAPRSRVKDSTTESLRSLDIRIIERKAIPHKVNSREIAIKTSKEGQPFLHVTHRRDPIYMPTKYYENISKGIKVIERIYSTTSFCLLKAQI